MTYIVRELEHEDFPNLLFQMDDPPEKLFIAGKLPGPENKFLCVVGSRKYSPYGKEICEKLIGELRGKDVVIVSGLALGMDTIAHEAAIKAGLKTIAIPGSGLHTDVLYPRTNLRLAERILESGGALISEFEEKFRATLYSFPQRNRIMAGMSHATLIIEAGEKSGTLITARLAMEYNRDVLVVPNGVFEINSIGSNRLIKDGAIPIFSSDDLLEHLGFEKNTKVERKDLNPAEMRVLEILSSSKTKDELVDELGMEISKVNILISSMEIKGLIKESTGKMYIA